ncbi:hypothetical protein CYLTODRAFT_389765 [Cylindrobasidium torrendii FP15055 ss-10]|uniref:KOW domain-containing protein n=1 Tax=Cylindrobasidium torrendii FP15055 ss-10 TaxID=1314674 RepID=A0A0D7BMM8_9AGAR|nr:hypothetical protein CYLTODRAFT_389765 [Cylindrobasidium torrendii FP15055 ss-10]
MRQRFLRMSAGAIQQATSSTQFVSHFQHLMPIHYKTLKDSAKYTEMRTPKVTAAKDRIKYWNIVPGDQVHIRGDPSNGIHTVKAVNRFTNRVFMASKEGDKENPNATGLNVHYSKCQLLVGEYSFPPPPGSIEPETRRVFARRIGTSAPSYNAFRRRIIWNRFATATDPPLTHLDVNTKRISIPWPAPNKPSPPPAQEWDTPRDEVARITYRPPTFPANPFDPVPQLVGTVTYRGGETIVPQPAEVFLEKELVNFHGFAKRHERWTAFQAFKKTLHAEYINRELKELNGRTQGAARADATFKWRQRLDQMYKEKINARQEFAKIKNERKTRRKIRKEHKKRERLSNMVLVEADNQFIPPSMLQKMERLAV